MRRLWGVLLAGPLLVLGGCTAHAEGEFHATGGAMGEWTLRPDMCGTTARRGYFGADLYRRDPREDTELVLLQDGDHPLLLVRVPGEKRMIAVLPSDCRVFEPVLESSGTRVNRVPVVAGSLKVDCELPEAGRIVGQATFDCL